MKKVTRLLFLVLISFNLSHGQFTSFVEAPQNNYSTTQLRAPNGLSSSAYMRASALVLQNELLYMPSTSTISSFGFTMTTSSSVSTPVAGNFTLYLENTSDATFLKGTTWSTILSGMTSCYASVLTIPLSASTTSFVVTLSTPFVYTGGGLYVAYDWFSNGPFSTTNPATYWSENAVLSGGCVSGVSSSSAPTSLTATNFRPSFLFGFDNPYSNDARVLAIESPGRIAGTLATPHTIRALVQNVSNVPLSNLTVSVNVSGANTFNNTQNIPSLAAGASTMVSFAPFNPLLPGTQTVTVSVPSDQFNANNSAQYFQEVTCNIWGQNPAVSGYSFTSVGFGTGSGMIGTPYLSPTTSTIIGLRGALSTYSANVGNTVYGVLLSSSGVILATSSNVVITAAMLGTFVNFTFPTPVVLSPSTSYYLAFAQTANSTGYWPAATLATWYLPQNIYYTFGLAGGIPALLSQNFGYFGLEAVFAHTVTLSATSPTVVCGSNATVTALSSTNYSWSTSATTSSIVVNTVTANAVYTVVATNTLGCMASKAATVFVNPLPLNISISPTLVCSGDPITLTASGASSYTWSSTAGTSNNTTLTDNPNASTNYSLTGSNPDGCSTNTVLNLFVNPLPLVNMAISSASVCAGSTVVLSASGNAQNYAWSTLQTGPSITLSPLQQATYTLTGTSAVGCSKSATATIYINTFTPGISTPTTVCEGEVVQLSATGASTLQWSTGSVFSSITVTPNVTTTYSVIGKGANNCVGTNETTITVNPNPTVMAVASKTSVCKGEKAVLSASGAVTYSWINVAAGPTVGITATTTALQVYTVVGLSAEGCSATAFVNFKGNGCTSILEQSITENQIQIYPSPSHGVFQLTIPETLVGSDFMIFNALGEKILALSGQKETFTFDISEQAAGFYFIQWQVAGENPRTLKFLKN